MNAVTTTGGPPVSLGLIPRNMQEAFQLAEMMARGKMMPEHLRNPGDALMVVEQAMRWNMSPFAVAQSTFSIKGKLLFAGTLVTAAVENSGAIVGLIDYQLNGEGLARKVVASALRRGETEPRTIEVTLKDAQTSNDMWKKQPDQQLIYHAARVWARRWTPGVMLGIYAPEEWRDADAFSGKTIDAEPLSTGQIIDDEIPAQPPPPKRTWQTLLLEIQGQLDCCHTEHEYQAIAATPAVTRTLTEAPEAVKDRLGTLLSAAHERINQDQTVGDEV